MKLIVDIPDNNYKWIKEHQGVTDFKTTQSLYESVINAVPLEDIKVEIQNTILEQAYFKGGIDSLEKIKADIEEYMIISFCEDDDIKNIRKILDEHMSELKGE